MVPSGSTKQWGNSGYLVKGPGDKKAHVLENKQTGSSPNTKYKDELRQIKDLHVKINI